MPLLNPKDSTLHSLLGAQGRPLVVCYCAAWCDTCTVYQQKLAALSDQLKDYVFVWVDIEDHPELLGDEDVENFPTLLIDRAGQKQFFGTMLPHIDQLERMIEATSSGGHVAAANTLPNVRLCLINKPS
ncbi:MAG: thioredoxin family protein [Burkholderiaceae bacterium]|nr:thioredoxin family protein [Burkholderiaceae bacterium]